MSIFGCFGVKGLIAKQPQCEGVKPFEGLALKEHMLVEMGHGYRAQCVGIRLNRKHYKCIRNRHFLPVPSSQSVQFFRGGQ